MYCINRDWSTNLEAILGDALRIRKALIVITTDAEKAAERFHRDKSIMDDEGRHYRFNLALALEDVGLKGSNKMEEIAFATSRYLESHVVYTGMRRLTQKVAEYNV
jgi:hypothetical protein